MRTDAREQAYVEFVTARQTHLRRIAYAICGDWDRADDLLQVALVKLYVAWPRVQRLGSEDAFVRRIIVRANVDEHRGSGRHQSPGAEGQGGATLFEALQALPAVQRKIVVLRHWLGLSVEETAEVLGVSPGTVMRDWTLVKAWLRREVSRHE